MIIERLTPNQWSELSENAYKASFGNYRPSTKDRVDFALLGVESGVPVGFITCYEHDSETIYWQFGGAFPGTLKTLKVLEYYSQAVDWCRGRYKKILTFIENTNLAMLRLAMKVGFRISGVRYYNGSILVEHSLTLEA